MGGLLDAANVSIDSDKFTIGKLPTKQGEVSIMTLEQAYKALGGSDSFADSPSQGYYSSTYYMYAINSCGGVNDSNDNSTSDNLQSVGLGWYQQLNKPTIVDNHWAVGNHKVFGGPLRGVYYDGGSSYYFNWYYSESSGNGSGSSYYWGSFVSGSVYVAIVRAK